MKSTDETPNPSQFDEKQFSSDRSKLLRSGGLGNRNDARRRSEPESGIHLCVDLPRFILEGLVMYIA
jgi:hypothetical protein